MEEASYAPHPYVPRDLILPGYVPVLLSPSTLSGVFLGASLLVTSLVWFLSGCLGRNSKVDRSLLCWWAFTGLSHMILEGYFVFSPQFYKSSSGFYIAELWKEYSKGDSRYAARDPVIVTIIGLTAVLVGPASILSVYAIARKTTYSYVLQFAVSLGQLYVNTVLYATAFLDGNNFAASQFYYYAYFVVPNAFWFLIPAIISVRCWKIIAGAVQFETQIQKKAKSC